MQMFIPVTTQMTLSRRENKPLKVKFSLDLLLTPYYSLIKKKKNQLDIIFDTCSLNMCMSHVFTFLIINIKFLTERG